MLGKCEPPLAILTPGICDKIFGQILASGVLRGTLDMQSNLAFRIPFAIQ